MNQIAIDPQTSTGSTQAEPYNAASFAQMRVTDAWRKYDGVLAWGRGQTLAILDDGCDLSLPQWKAQMPHGPKVVAVANTLDETIDPLPFEGHGTTVGFPSSLNHDGVLGVAYNDQVAHLRCLKEVHLTRADFDATPNIAAALQWVIDHHQKYNITTVNLSPADDGHHQKPKSSILDPLLEELRNLQIWVSAPCANNGFTDGISWPACAEYSFAIGATVQGEARAHLDRYANTDLLVCARATSTSNNYAAGCSMVLREAIEQTNYDWRCDASTLPAAMMRIFQQTGRPIHDADSGCDFRELDLLAALDHVFASASI